MTEPWFWRDDAMAARAARMTLMPAALVYDAGQRLRGAFSRAVDPGVPVICVGNATAGGVGKTPFALLLQRLLAAVGVDAAFVSRGYGGTLQGPVRVAPQHTAEEVGDEPLLLASAGPTWVAKNRAAGVVAAAAAGAKLLIMDDGFQNPTVKKTLSFLLLGGDEGDLAPFPAGPLREPLARAVARADAVVETGAQARPPSPARERAEGRFHTHTDILPSIAPQPVFAFCGIARPERFFNALEEKGFMLAGRAAFPDHHPFSLGDVGDLRRRAKAAGAALITTEKDVVRLGPAEREGIALARLTMRVDDPQRLVDFVRQRIAL